MHCFKKKRKIEKKRIKHVAVVFFYVFFLNIAIDYKLFLTIPENVNMNVCDTLSLFVGNICGKGRILKLDLYNLNNLQIH